MFATPRADLLSLRLNGGCDTDVVASSGGDESDGRATSRARIAGIDATTGAGTHPIGAIWLVRASRCQRPTCRLRTDRGANRSPRRPKWSPGIANQEAPFFGTNSRFVVVAHGHDGLSRPDRIELSGERDFGIVGEGTRHAKTQGTDEARARNDLSVSRPRCRIVACRRAARTGCCETRTQIRKRRNPGSGRSPSDRRASAVREAGRISPPL